MAFPIRSLHEISRRVRGAIRQYLRGTDAWLKENVLYVIGKVMTLLAGEFELRMQWLSKQMLLSTATDEAWIRRHAADVGIVRRGAAPAAGTVIGTGTPEVAYPAGIRLVSGGHTYLTASATADAGGMVAFVVTCEQAGAATNRDEGAVLYLADASLYPTLGQEFEVGVAGLGGGADVEALAELKSRGLFRKRNPPRSGALTDYEDIARSVPGVTKAWAFRVANAAGAVTVLFLHSARANGIPEAGDVAAVQAAIDARRLIRVDAGEAAAPVALPVDVTIAGLAPDTDDIRAAIETAIRAMFLTRCRPGIADDPFTVSLSWISEAISGAAGEDSHALVAPAADIVLTGGQFPVLGTMTYA